MRPSRDERLSAVFRAISRPRKAVPASRPSRVPCVAISAAAPPTASSASSHTGSGSSVRPGRGSTRARACASSRMISSVIHTGCRSAPGASVTVRASRVGGVACVTSVAACETSRAARRSGTGAAGRGSTVARPFSAACRCASPAAAFRCVPGRVSANGVPSAERCCAQALRREARASGSPGASCQCRSVACPRAASVSRVRSCPVRATCRHDTCRGESPGW